MSTPVKKSAGYFMTFWMIFWPIYFDAFKSAMAADAATVTEGTTAATSSLRGGKIDAGSLQTTSDEIISTINSASTRFDSANAQAQGQALMNNTSSISSGGQSNAANLSTDTGDTAEAYQAIKAGRNSDAGQAARVEAQNSAALHSAQTYIRDNASTVFDQFTTGCITTTTNDDTRTNNSNVSQTKTCTQVKQVVEQGAVCSATRNVTLTPIATKVVYAVLPNAAGGSGINDGTSSNAPVCDSFDYSSYCGVDFNCAADRTSAYGTCMDDCLIDAGMNHSACASYCGNEADSLEQRCLKLKPGYSGHVNVSSDAVSAVPSTTNEIIAIGVTNVTAIITPFDLSSYGSGSYVVANHQLISQPWVSNGTLIYGGTNNDKWHYQFEFDVNNGKGFEIQATLYEVTTNDFVPSNCDSTHFPEFMSGTCTGTASCLDYSSCRVVDGVNVCDTGPTAGISEVLASWGTSANLTNMCWNAHIEMSGCMITTDACTGGSCTCDGLTGDEYTACMSGFCWMDSSGNQQCASTDQSNMSNNIGDPGWVDDCKDLLADTKCLLSSEAPTSRACDPTMMDANGICHLREVKFECRSATTLTLPTSSTSTTVCAGDLPCQGDSCFTQRDEQNTSYGTVATAMSAVQALKLDGMNCLTSDPSTCSMFKGEQKQCKDPVGVFGGVIPECCKMAKEGGEQASDMEMYMTLLTGGYELNMNFDSIGDMASGHNGVVGAMATGSGFALNPLVTSWDAMVNTLGLDSTSASVISSAGAWAINTGGGAWIAEGFLNLAPDVFGSMYSVSGGSVIWSNPSVAAAAGNIGAFVHVIWTVYLAYSIIKIVASLIWKCEDEELEFGVQWANKACHYMGKYCSKSINLTPLGPKKCVIEKQSYCCYNSPFARIIQEQVKGAALPFAQRSSYQGIEWGSTKSPSCGALTIADLQNLDWGNVDLSEWEEIMLESNMVALPNGASAGYGKQAQSKSNLIPTTLGKPKEWQGRIGGGAAATFGQSDSGYQNSVDRNKAMARKNREAMEKETDVLVGQGEAAYSQHDANEMPWLGETFKEGARSVQSAPPAGDPIPPGGGGSGGGSCGGTLFNKVCIQLKSAEQAKEKAANSKNDNNEKKQ